MAYDLWAEKTADYLAYLPDCLQNTHSFEALSGAMDKGLNDYKAALRQALESAFVDSAATEIVRRWEKILAIPEKDIALEIRKAKVLSRLREKVPINQAMIRSIASDMLGEIVKFEQGQGDNWVIIKYRNESPFSDGDFGKSSIIRALPANLKVEVLFAFLEWGEAQSKKWQILQGKTWQDVMLYKF